MPVVHTRHTTDRPIEQVWKVVLDCEAFPDYMPEVREIEIMEQDGELRVSRWAVLLKGSELEWEERERIDHAAHRIEFEQIEGDLAYFTGHWQVSDSPEGTMVELRVEFDIGIPLMAEMLNPVAARALEDNSRAILDQIGRRAGVAVP
ncbi:type II toxin-antitoxin system RatA family toxin [Microbispora sp. NPDC049125]|uniref:type II toxin-antitoxin system RatA family toxin n=1 Tax=Microbispora sp. NPDC049125 TaxID=3154929 RepID=UPI00346571E8